VNGCYNDGAQDWHMHSAGQIVMGGTIDNRRELNLLLPNSLSPD